MRLRSIRLGGMAHGALDRYREAEPGDDFVRGARDRDGDLTSGRTTPPASFAMVGSTGTSIGYQALLQARQEGHFEGGLLHRCGQAVAAEGEGGPELAFDLVGKPVLGLADALVDGGLGGNRPEQGETGLLVGGGISTIRSL